MVPTLWLLVGITSTWLPQSQSQLDGPLLLTWASLNLLCDLWHWVLLDNFVHRILVYFICHLGGTPGFCLLFSFFCSPQRDSLIFSSTPQPQLRDSPFSLPPSPKRTFYSKLIIILLETSPIPGVTGIHARSLPLTSTGHYFLLPPACFEREWPQFTRSMLWLCKNRIFPLAVLLVSFSPFLSEKF